MRISGRKIAITGAGRGLGAALAIVLADAGGIPVLLGRTKIELINTARIVESRTDNNIDSIKCDLSVPASCADAGKRLVDEHSNLDGIIHNGAMWLPGSIAEISDQDIQACVASAAIGSIILTRHVLPVLLERPEADIHTIVSTSGLTNMPLDGVSVAFRAAKSAQHGFVQGLYDELLNTGVRVTSIYPGNIKDISPLDSEWTQPRGLDDSLTNREVIDAIVFMLNLPASAAVKELVIE